MFPEITVVENTILKVETVKEEDIIDCGITVKDEPLEQNEDASIKFESPLTDSLEMAPDSPFLTNRSSPTSSSTPPSPTCSSPPSPTCSSPPSPTCSSPPSPTCSSPPSPTCSSPSSEALDRARRLVIKKRKVNSIDSSLDESNFNPHFLPEEEVVSVLINKKTKTSEEKKVTWTSIPPVRHRTAAENVIDRRPDVKQAVSHAATPVEAWSCFITDDIITEIVNSTNKSIRDKVELVNGNASFYYVGFTDAAEIKAFIGLLYMRGVLQLNHLSFRILFSEKVGPSMFPAAMSENRFSFLHANITFDDIDTRKDCWMMDKFTAIRNVFEIFNKNCASAVNPSDYISLGETLYPYRNKISSKQCNSNQPSKYSILFKSLNSARFAYTYQTTVYSGKPETESSPYYVEGITPGVKQLVHELEKHSVLKGVTISMDRLHTDYELFEWLLQKNITAVGTMQANRRAIPRQLSSTVDREQFSYRVLWEKSSKKISLHSYVVNTKSKGKENVLAMATVPVLLGTTTDDNKNKPALLNLFDFTKNGTDIVNQRINAFTVNTRSKRWTILVFTYLLDTARVNSQSLWALNKGIPPASANSFDFAFELAEQLVKPFIEKRKTEKLSTWTKNKINNVLATNPSDAIVDHSSTVSPVLTETSAQTIMDSAPSTSTNACSLTPAPLVNQAKRCYKCVDELDTHDRRAKYGKLSKVTTKCEKCCKALCKRHTFKSCSDCK